MRKLFEKITKKTKKNDDGIAIFKQISEITNQINISTKKAKIYIQEKSSMLNSNFKNLKLNQNTNFEHSQEPSIFSNEKFQFLYPYKKQVLGAVSMLCATVMVISCSVFLKYLDNHEDNFFAKNSFTVFSNGNELCKIRSEEDLEEVLQKIQNELSEESNLDLIIDSNFEIMESQAIDKEILSNEDLYDLIKSNLNYSVLGYAIKIDNEKVGVTDTKETAEKVIENVKEYFTRNYNKESLLEVSIAEEVVIEEESVPYSEIKDVEGLTNYIIKGTDEEQEYTVEKGDNFWNISNYFNMSLDDLISANPNSDPEKIQIGDKLNLVVPKSFVNIEVKRELLEEEKIKYETEYEYVSYMYNDEEVVNKKGSYGKSEIKSIVTERNGIQIAKEVVSEKVIEKPVTQVVLTGTQDPPPKQGSGYFINPLPGATITSPFGSRSGGFHRGQDMAKPTGTPIKAADGGKVTFSGYNGTYGYVIDIDHGGGYVTRYAHASELYVSAGEQVYQGQVIAAVGSTGYSTGPHLHFEVMKYGNLQNPANFIGAKYK